MYLQLALVVWLISSPPVLAQPAQAEVNELFTKYESVMSGEKITLTEVFSPEFIPELGDTKDLQKSAEKSQSPQRYDLVIKPSRRNPNMAYVKRIPAGSNEKPHSSFVLIKRRGKWVIQGTISDDE